MNLAYEQEFSRCRRYVSLNAYVPAAASFGIFDSKSSTDALQQTVSTQGGSSPSIGLDKSKGAVVALGTAPVVTTKGDVTFNTLDGGAIPALQDIAKQALINNSNQTAALFDQIDYSLAQNSQASRQANDAATTLLQQSLASQSDLAKSNATGGQSDTNKVILWVVGIAALLIGVLFWKNK